MRTTAIPDTFFVLERIDAAGSPPMPFLLKRDLEDAPAAEFVDELRDLFTLVDDSPRSCSSGTAWRRFTPCSSSPRPRSDAT